MVNTFIVCWNIVLKEFMPNTQECLPIWGWGGRGMGIKENKYKEGAIFEPVMSESVLWLEECD